MDTEDGDFIVEGTHGSPDDVKFDEAVGVIEDFMISCDLDAVLKKVLPPFASVKTDHDRHSFHRKVVDSVEKDLDTYVMKHCTSVSSMEELAALLQSRQSEISEDVWDFISDGCFDYSGFLEKWEAMDLTEKK